MLYFNFKTTFFSPMLLGIIIFFTFYTPSIAIYNDNKTMPSNSLFIQRDFARYFFADRYSPITNIGVGPMLVANDYDIDPRKRLIALIAEPVIGVQIPVYYYRDNIHRLAVSIPIAMSIWFDFTERRTAPILNTDYRFALFETNYSHKINNSLIDNIGFTFIPIFHESTHVGDELTIARMKDSIPSPRINVSYETFELAMVLNDPYEQKIKNHTFKIGAKFLWDPSRGYYTTDPFEIGESFKIKPSKRWVEPYIRYQYQDPNCFLSNDRMMFIYSQDLSLRVRYGYPFSYYNKEKEIVITKLGESYQPCTNILIGWRLLDKNQNLSDTSIFLKIYLGINPHGQFRNIPLYPWIGLNLVHTI